MKVTLVKGIEHKLRAIQASPVWKDWRRRLGPHWQGRVVVNAIDEWKNQIHSLQLTVQRKKKPWAEPITLRSETVDVLVTVTDDPNNTLANLYVVLIQQWRDAVGRNVTSNVAGGKAWDETIEAAADRELREELLLDRYKHSIEAHLMPLVPYRIYASPGMLSERVYMFRAHLQLRPGDLRHFVKHLENNIMGNPEEGEVITAYMLPASEVWRKLTTEEAEVDSKTLLSRNGRV